MYVCMCVGGLQKGRNIKISVREYKSLLAFQIGYKCISVARVQGYKVSVNTCKKLKALTWLFTNRSRYEKVV